MSKKTREQAVEEKAKQLAQGGWSSIYSYVDRTFPDEDWQWEEDENQDEMENQN